MLYRSQSLIDIIGTISHLQSLKFPGFCGHSGEGRQQGNRSTKPGFDVLALCFGKGQTMSTAGLTQSFPHVPTMGAGAISSKLNSEPMNMQNKKPKPENTKPSDRWKNKRRVDWYQNCNYSEICLEQKDCCFQIQSQVYFQGSVKLGRISPLVDAGSVGILLQYNFKLLTWKSSTGGHSGDSPQQYSYLQALCLENQLQLKAYRGYISQFTQDNKCLSFECSDCNM